MITRTWPAAAAVALFLVLPVQSPAAPLRDLPVTWTQPDGTDVTVFATGDEYRRHTVDRDGFTVLRNLDTGWLVYADMIDGRLAPTDLAVGIDDPMLAGLRPGLRMPPDQIGDNVRRRLTPRVSGDYTPTTGTVNNLFIFIRFNDDDILMEETAGYELQFNGVAPGEPSMRAYFREVSLDAVDVVTTFTPPPDGKWMTAYTAPQNRRYYQVYDAVHNPTGYRNEGELEQREHALLKDALAYVEQFIPDGVDFDANDDGWFDNVIFMVQGWPDNWSDLLWPHKWEFYDEAWCKGLKVGTYNLQLSVLMLISPGTFVHEMYHSFGAPDLYHYSLDGIDAVGPWDVMDNTGLYAAQHPLAYMKWKYGAWIEDIPLIEQNQEVILTADWVGGDQAVRVNVPESVDEYFIMEYRRAEGMFESSLPDSGLLVYRIDPSRAPEGNRNGPPDEVYVFRPGGVPYATGEINRAAMRVGRRTVMNEFTDPKPALGDGTPVTLRVYDVGEAGNNIAFKVCLNPPGCGEKVCGSDGCGGWCGDCTAGNYCVEGACLPCGCSDRVCGDDGCGNSCGECDDENPCTSDNCDAGICVFPPDIGAACDDGDPTTENDVCDDMATCHGVAIPMPDVVVVDEYAPDAGETSDVVLVPDISGSDTVDDETNAPDDTSDDADQAEIVEETKSKGCCSQGGGGTAIPAVIMLLGFGAILQAFRRRFFA